MYGTATIEEIEEAGAFDRLKIFPERAAASETVQEPFFKKYARVIISLAFVLMGYASHWFNGEASAAFLPFLAAILIGGYPLFKTGLKNLVRLEFDMRTLMTIAIIGAAIIGEWSEGAVVVILFAISEELEKFSMDKARASIRSLMDIAPKEALIRRNGDTLVIPADEIEIGDIMIVKPGQKLAMDGIVTKGHSTVNQAAITGESVPVEKKERDDVYAGTLNEEGILEVEVTKLVADTAIAKIIHLVEEAQAEKAPAQAFIDRFAKYYTPIIMAIAALVAIVPPLLFGAGWNEWIYQGLSVLVVGCPCALVISTPVSIVTAIGNAARNGVLIKGGIHLEETGALNAIAFDKTGTLTKGVPAVTDIIALKGKDEKEILSVLAALEYGSQHPLASAILKKAEDLSIPFKDVFVEDASSVTGKGIKGRINGTSFFAGSPAFMADVCREKAIRPLQAQIESLQKEGKTVMALFSEKDILALVGVADEVRESSREVIDRLHGMGIKRTVMLTGDNAGTARAIGAQTGVTDIRAELLPEDKLSIIKELRKDYGKVAMVGDGINDAPALAAATIGIAMGGAGTDTALETADLALMGDDLRKLPFAIKLSRKALAIIKQNITFSLALKLVALLLVIPGWLTLWIAIFADMGATLLVTLNGLRLLKVK